MDACAMCINNLSSWSKNYTDFYVITVYLVQSDNKPFSKVVQTSCF